MPGADRIPAPSYPRRILAFRAGALGDTVLALPAIAALETLADGLEVAGTMPYIELARGPGLARDVHSVDRACFRSFFAAEADDAELMSLLGRFDLVVSWARLPLLGEKLRVLGIPWIEATPHPPEGVHASDHLLEALTPLGIRGPAGPPKVELDPTPPEFGMNAGSFLAIHPSSGSAKKNWPTERFAELARLARAAGLGILWIQGEADAEVVPPLARAVPAAVARRLPLRVLAAVVARSAVFVGNDSGVSHLAAAAGAKTIALFGATNPRQWAPRGERVRVGSTGASPEDVWGFARELMVLR